MSRELPIYACTLTRSDARARREADRALAELVRATERFDLGVRVVVGGGPRGRDLVDTFVSNESACCGFFEFSVEERDGDVVLEITAPDAPEAQQLVDDAKRTFDAGPEGVTWPAAGEAVRG